MDAREEARRAAIARARRDRADVRREIEAGQRPTLPDLTDDEVGAEAVRLVKQSRRKRGAAAGQSQTTDQLPWDSVVSRDPEVHSGDIVFRGTRVPVETLIDHLKGGHSIEDFLDGFPSVQRWQVEAFLDLAWAAADPLPR